MKLLLTILIIILLVGCKGKYTVDKNEPRMDVIVLDQNKIDNEKVERSYNLRTIVYDSCEYILVSDNPAGWAITHKGNCKFCQQRNKK